MPEAPRSRTLLWILIGGGAFFLFVLAVFSLVYLTLHAGGTEAGGFSSFGDRIGVVDLDGVILSPQPVVGQLKKFGDDSSIKAIIIHVNSPGGGVAASEEIYREVKRIRDEKKKRIVVSIETVGASGAFYVASASNKIYADKGSIVGSIGVIAQWVNYGDLLKWAKMKNITISRGDLKDAGDPTRDLTPQEQAYFQSLVDNMYGQFIHDVATGRHTPEDKIKPLATGQVWTGEQALPLGLIDQQGGFRIALMDTAKSVGISGEPHIVRPSKEKHRLAALLSDGTDELFPNPSKLLDRAPGFYFLWK